MTEDACLRKRRLPASLRVAGKPRKAAPYSQNLRDFG
ncbi:hypothetical protein ABIC71_002152 [Herbaspirillum seropedicae]|jgi:hypothetical protein